MAIKQLAFDTQQYLQSHSGISFKRGHIYELLAASFGFGSYASLSAEHVFTQGSIAGRRPAKYQHTVGRRTLELDYSPQTAIQLAQVLPNYLAGHDIGVIRIADLVAHLRYASDRATDEELNKLDRHAQNGEDLDGQWLDFETIHAPILLDGLKLLAEKGDANAHYALALLYHPSDEASEEPGSDYWYNQERLGRVLSGIEKEWADAHASMLARTENYEHHLRAAGALGHEVALLEMAERLGDPTFFNRRNVSLAGIDALHAARAAEVVGLYKEANRWLTLAAQRGDTKAMLELIESYDRPNPQQCWVWFYLAELLGVDLLRKGGASHQRRWLGLR